MGGGQSLARGEGRERRERVKKGKKTHLDEVGLDKRGGQERPRRPEDMSGQQDQPRERNGGVSAAEDGLELSAFRGREAEEEEEQREGEEGEGEGAGCGREGEEGGEDGGHVGRRGKGETLRGERRGSGRGGRRGVGCEGAVRVLAQAGLGRSVLVVLSSCVQTSPSPRKQHCFASLRVEQHLVEQSVSLSSCSRARWAVQ